MVVYKVIQMDSYCMALFKFSPTCECDCTIIGVGKFYDNGSRNRLTAL